MVHRSVRSKSLCRYIAALSMGMLTFSTIAASGLTGAEIADRAGMILTCGADRAVGHTCCPPSERAASRARSLTTLGIGAERSAISPSRAASRAGASLNLDPSSREAGNDCSCAPAGSAPHQPVPAIPTLTSRASAEPLVCKVSLMPAALWVDGVGSKAAFHSADLRPTASGALPLFVLYRSLLI